jgi:IPT/TIG domain
MRKSILALLLVVLASTAGAVPVITSFDPQEGFNFGPTYVTITGTGFSGGTVEVFFGDVKATVFESNATTIRVLAYPTLFGTVRPEGPVDVKVRVVGHGETVQANAFYFSPFAQPGEENYVRVLVPLTATSLQGANGSIWTSQLRVFNSSFTSPLRMPGPEAIFQSPPIDPAIVVNPRKTQQVFLSRRSSNVDGAFLYVPRPLAYAPKWSLRVRDLSKNATSLGTAVPVVIAGDAAGDAKGELTLHDLPIDPNTRATLRIYAFTEAPMQVGISVYAENVETPIEERVVSLDGIVNVIYEPFGPHPAYIALDPFSQAVRDSGVDRVRIEITNFGVNVSPPPPPIWAFVSFTNNVTQQVTVVTPQ